MPNLILGNKYLTVELNQIGHNWIDFVHQPDKNPVKNQFGYLSIKDQEYEKVNVYLIIFGYDVLYAQCPKPL